MGWSNLSLPVLKEGTFLAGGLVESVMLDKAIFGLTFVLFQLHIKRYLFGLILDHSFKNIMNLAEIESNNIKNNL